MRGSKKNGIDPVIVRRIVIILCIIVLAVLHFWFRNYVFEQIVKYNEWHWWYIFAFTQK